MKLPVKQILKGEVVCSFGWFFRKAASLREHAPANVLYTPFGRRWESHSPGQRAHPTVSYLQPVPTLPAPPRPAAGSWIPPPLRAPAFIDWGGEGESGGGSRARSDGRAS